MTSINSGGTVEMWGSSPLALAVECAIEWHADQKRKGTNLPYVTHLLAVTAIVLEAGGSLEVHAPAAMLHDVVEDTTATLEQIERQFGPAVTAIVAGCSDADDPANKGPWEQRKRTYLRHLGNASIDVLIVSLADKLHNCSSIVDDYRDHGTALWDRFNADAAKQLWYYRSLLEVYESRRNELSTEAQAVLERFTRAFEELIQIVEKDEPESLEALQAFGEKMGDS